MSKIKETLYLFYRIQNTTILAHFSSFYILLIFSIIVPAVAIRLKIYFSDNVQSGIIALVSFKLQFSNLRIFLNFTKPGCDEQRRHHQIPPKNSGKMQS